MVFLTVNHGVHCTVNVQQNAIIAAPVRQRGVGGETSSQEVMHDDRHFEFFRVLGTLQHLFASTSGHV